MALRAITPEPSQKRLKLFVYGEAGVGKTTCALQFPKAYCIDAERGMENYHDLIIGSKSVVFSSIDFMEIEREVHSLMTTKHDYRTLVIDPLTPVYQGLLEQGEALEGTEWGRHYSYAAKQLRRLTNKLMRLDMNIIITSHAKAEYGDEMKRIGTTFDCWNKIDYVFDLVLLLERQGDQRWCLVKKSRLPEKFKDGERFEWSYRRFVAKYGGRIAKDAVPIKMADPDQVAQLKQMLKKSGLDSSVPEKWLEKAGVIKFDDMEEETISKCIEFMNERNQAHEMESKAS